VFASLNCASCHGGAGFTNSGENTLSNIGTIKPSSGSRCSALTGIDIPTLRDVWATAPYLHDGSAPTLEAAVRAHNNVVDRRCRPDEAGRLPEGDRRRRAAAPAPAGTGTGLTGRYYNNTSLSGTRC
jgi:cytochrome c peroxidase